MKNKAHHNIKVAFWVIIIISVVALGAMVTMLQKTIGGIDRDPSLVTLTVDGAAKFAQIINLKKTTDLKPGLYIIKDMELKGPQSDLLNKEIFLLSEDYVRQTLGGFMLEGQKYYRKITVSYPSDDILLAEVETQNSAGESYFQSIKLNK